MARPRIATCIDCGHRRAAVSVSIHDMRCTLVHQLDLCATCARHPHCIVNGVMVEQGEVAAHDAQARRA